MFLSANQYIQQCVSREVTRGRAVAVWAIIVAGMLVVLGLLFLAPLALARGHVFLAFSIYQAFHLICHQMPERSFHVAGHQLAVCARCTGIYAGFTAGVVFYPLARSIRKIETPRRIWLLLAMLPMAVDFSLTFFGLWQNTHLSRLLTGALFGAVTALYIVPGLIDLSQIILNSLAARKSLRRLRSEMEMELGTHSRASSGN